MKDSRCEELAAVIRIHREHCNDCGGITVLEFVNLLQAGPENGFRVHCGVGDNHCGVNKGEECYDIATARRNDPELVKYLIEQDRKRRNMGKAER